MSDCELYMRQAAKDLLNNGAVQLILGYETGTLEEKTRPVFITNADDCDKLVYNEKCVNNLVSYLPRLMDKGCIAVITRPCDVRTLVGLIQEKQVQREKVHIITFRPSGSGDAVPPIYDTLLETDVEIEPTSIEHFQTLSEQPASERWKAFEEAMSKCIRCYACRNACPMCYCDECFVERSVPRWVGEGSNLSDTMVFHLTRAMHVAGRCGECDACVRACPMGIDLKIINQKINADLLDLFGHRAGTDPDSPAALSTFDPNDYNSFIK